MGVKTIVRYNKHNIYKKVKEWAMLYNMLKHNSNKLFSYNSFSYLNIIRKQSLDYNESYIMKIVY